MVAGLFPDMPAFDPRGKNEGGYAWETGFERINPAFFDQADLKVQWLIRNEIVPLIVGAWGYYLPWLGVERMKKHWRYLVARWGAYPVVWCLAGEVTMPWYLSERKEADQLDQRAGWAEVGNYLKQIDPYHRPITAHTAYYGDSAKELTDPTSLDFNFIQTGHGNLNVAIGAAKRTHEVLRSTSLHPVVQGELCYEGILGVAWQDVQRFCFGVACSWGPPGIVMEPTGCGRSIDLAPLMAPRRTAWPGEIFPGQKH